MSDLDQNYFQIKDAISWKDLAASSKNPETDKAWLDQIQNVEHGQLSLDIYETPADLVIEAPLAGVKPEDLEISLQNDMLTIKGRRERQSKVERDHMIYQECHWGQFSRTIILPVDVVAERIEASLKQGILTIHLPKAKPMRKIKVKST